METPTPNFINVSDAAAVIEGEVNENIENLESLSGESSCTIKWLDNSLRVSRTMSGEPAFYAKDVYSALGIDVDNCGDMMDRIRNIVPFAFPEDNLILEPGLYVLAFCSDKQEAVDFLRWVNAEVIPTVRKYSVYVEGETSTDVLRDLRSESVMQRELLESRLDAVNTRLQDLATVIHSSSHPLDDSVSRSTPKRQYKAKPYSDEQEIMYKLLHEQAAQAMGSKRSANATFKGLFTSRFWDTSSHKYTGLPLNQIGSAIRDGVETSGTVDDFLDCCRNAIEFLGFRPITRDIWDAGLELQNCVDLDDLPSDPEHMDEAVTRLNNYVAEHRIGNEEFKFLSIDDITLKD